jgi:hypothetical protein
MTTNIEQFSSAGIDRAYWARNNSNGYAMGTTGTLANGADASFSQLVGVQSFGVTLQEPRKVNIEGDDGVQSVFFFESAELPSGDLVLGVFDVNFYAQTQGTRVYADGDFDVILGQPGAATYNQISIITNSKGQSKMAGSSGQAGWMVKMYPKVQVVPKGDAGLTSAGATNFTHALIVNKSDKMWWGESFTVANHGTTEAAVFGPLSSEYRVCGHTHVSDAADLTFTLTYLPAAANGNKVKVRRNGTALAYTTDYTVNASTGVVTLVAAGTAGDIVTVRYEHV